MTLLPPDQAARTVNPVLTHGSLFSGVGGIDLGFEAAGIETKWQCEIDDRPRSVLARHWPNATQYTDVCTVKGDEVTPVDIVTFGSPCQDLSVAGKRAGFDGARSGLFFEAVRIIKEMRDETGGAFPRLAVWENVRGALSSNGGHDFAAAIQALADIGAVDISWRVVNTCHFGPPQRRVRVFVVADFGGECAGEILAEPTRVLWHPGSGGTPGTEPAGETEDGLGDSGWQTERNTVDALTIGGWYDAQEACAGRLVYTFDGYNQKLETDGPHRTPRTGTDSGDFVAVLASAELRMRAGKPGGGKGALIKDDMSLTLQTGNDQALFAPKADTYRVRRLTPRECERLQGWPDDHTRYDNTGKEISDAARYKMSGNGVSAPVAQWIGENIVAALTPN